MLSVWYNPKRMEVLDLRIRVSGHQTLDHAIRESLLAGEAFKPLTHSVQMRMFAQVLPSNLMTVQIQDSAVLIAEDWVVSIHGKKLIDCVSAMSVLINSISQRLNTPVEVDLLTHENGKGESLHKILDRQAQRERFFRVVIYLATIALSASAGVALQWLI